MSINTGSAAGLEETDLDQAVCSLADVVPAGGPLTEGEARAVAVAAAAALARLHAAGGVHGRLVNAGLAIYDTMQYIRSDISSVCIGQAASMGSLLLAAGAKGKRFSLPHSRIMLHQPSGGFQGQATDIEIHAREILDLRARLNRIYVAHTGQDIQVIEDALDRDKFMSPEEAREFGLIDDVVTQRPVPDEAGGKRGKGS